MADGDIPLHPVTPTDINGRPIGGSDRPIYVTQAVAALGGGITWGAATAVAGTGASKVLIAANALRKALMVWNPVGNDEMSYVPGATVASLAAGRPMNAGDVDTITAPEVSLGAYAFWATNTQNVYYMEGT